MEKMHVLTQGMWNEAGAESLKGREGVCVASGGPTYGSRAHHYFAPEHVSR